MSVRLKKMPSQTFTKKINTSQIRRKTAVLSEDDESDDSNDSNEEYLENMNSYIKSVIKLSKLKKEAFFNFTHHHLYDKTTVHNFKENNISQFNVYLKEEEFKDNCDKFIDPIFEKCRRSDILKDVEYYYISVRKFALKFGITLASTEYVQNFVCGQEEDAQKYAPEIIFTKTEDIKNDYSEQSKQVNDQYRYVLNCIARNGLSFQIFQTLYDIFKDSKYKVEWKVISDHHRIESQDKIDQFNRGSVKLRRSPVERFNYLVGLIEYHQNQLHSLFYYFESHWKTNLMSLCQDYEVNDFKIFDIAFKLGINEVHEKQLDHEPQTKQINIFEFQKNTEPFYKMVGCLVKKQYSSQISDYNTTKLCML